MSIWCNTLTALHLTFGVFCQPGDNDRVVALPDNDKDVWEIAPPSPPPAPKAPDFPPVVIEQPAPPPPPPPPAPKPAPAPVAAPPEPTPPSPYRLALEAVYSQPPEPANISVVFDGADQEAPRQVAALKAGEKPMAIMQPPNTQERYEADSQTSGLPVDNSRIVAADRYIHGILEKGFNSQLDSAEGGEVIIQTSRTVFGYHGRNELIPPGSRIKCRYTSPGKQGVSRVGFDCYRLLRGNDRAELLQLSAAAGDVQGHAGVTGEVDNRFFEKYGTAIILASVSAATRLATAAAAANSENSPLGNIADKGSEELAQKFGEISASVTEQTVNLAQIITASQGTRVVIMPSQDWYIRKIGDKQ